MAGMGFINFYVEISGDIQCHGHSSHGKPWRVGIRSPFAMRQIVKIVQLSDRGIATSGNYIQKRHIYNPHAPGDPLDEVVSLTVIGPDILEADRFATAAFAMGRAGLEFIESMPDLEGYEIDAGGMARMTSGLAQYLAPSA
jgi:thiamine biosynthesis lipoprotein